MNPNSNIIVWDFDTHTFNEEKHRYIQLFDLGINSVFCVSKKVIDYIQLLEASEILQTEFKQSLASLMWLKKECDGDFEKMKDHHSHFKYRKMNKDKNLTDEECKLWSMTSLLMLFFGSRQQLMNIPIPVWTQSVLEKHVCACCEKISQSKMKKCSGCENEYYCSAECQKIHWKQHKKVCGK